MLLRFGCGRDRTRRARHRTQGRFHSTARGFIGDHDLGRGLFWRGGLLFGYGHFCRSRLVGHDRFACGVRYLRIRRRRCRRR